MPNVLTETEDDPVERYLKSERRLASFRRRQFTGPIKCLLCDFTTQAFHDAGLSYEEQEEAWSTHSDAQHPLVRVNPERSRLEREALVAARKWYEARLRSSRTTYSTLEKLRLNGDADAELASAIRILINFESQHKQ